LQERLLLDADVGGSRSDVDVGWHWELIEDFLSVDGRSESSAVGLNQVWR